MSETKLCPIRKPNKFGTVHGCGQELPVSEFIKNRNWCRSCYNKKEAERQRADNLSTEQLAKRRASEKRYKESAKGHKVIQAAKQRDRRGYLRKWFVEFEELEAVVNSPSFNPFIDGDKEYLYAERKARREGFSLELSELEKLDLDTAREKVGLERQTIEERSDPRTVALRELEQGMEEFLALRDKYFADWSEQNPMPHPGLEPLPSVAEQLLHEEAFSTQEDILESFGLFREEQIKNKDRGVEEFGAGLDQPVLIPPIREVSDGEQAKHRENDEWRRVGLSVAEARAWEDSEMNQIDE